ncbi:MAG: transglycosylase domain-containing protein [Herminiimonas sp.]|nr:transglycosylase domain-containing protein [Herminiimonas sp.]
MDQPHSRWQFAQRFNPAVLIARVVSNPRAARILTITVLVIGGLILLFVGYIGYLIPSTPSIDDLREVRTARPSTLISADGKPLASFRQTQQERIELKNISPLAIKALIATEDRRFYAHHGVDFVRTLSAVFKTVGGDTQGGSTLTQQLARNLYPEEIGRSRSLDRKMREMVTALKIERAYSKDQILETYFNSVPFLYNVTGIEMAARTYYDKSAAQLDLLESATLIGMLKGTSYYNPVVSPERAQKRRDVVLGQMVKYAALPPATYAALRGTPVTARLYRQPDPLGAAPHFAAHVRKWLIEWADQNGYDIYADGLVVQTTIDQRLQEAATQAVERQAQALQNIANVEWSEKPLRVQYVTAAYEALQKKVEPFKYFWSTSGDTVDAFIRETPEYKQARDGGADEPAALAKLKTDVDFIARLRAAKTRLESGFVAIDPTNGEVRAWVGSRDFKHDQFDHVAAAERQPGSTFKPIVYGAALEQGLSPDRTYQDSAVEIRMGDGAVWRPTDMNGNSGKPMSLRDGLVYSKNTITAQVMQDVGLPGIVKLARSVGIDRSKLDPVPSLALGTSPVTLLEMVSAYSTIASEGAYHKPVFIKRISDRNGRVIAEFTTETRRAMSAESSIQLIDMMRGVVNKGTGQAVKTRFGIVADIAGKTGTTQNNTDGWFILMHPNLVAGAWVGFNDARVTMRSSYWGQGGHNAILVVGDFFRDALKTKLIDVKAQFPKPPPRAPQPVYVTTPPEDWMNQPEGEQPAVIEVQSQPRSGTGIIVREDGSSLVIDGATGSEVSRRTGGEAPAVSADELGQVMSGMGRDPVTGAAK